jgi:hypothetical protein
MLSLDFVEWMKPSILLPPFYLFISFFGDRRKSRGGESVGGCQGWDSCSCSYSVFVFVFVDPLGAVWVLGLVNRSDEWGKARNMVCSLY